MKKDYVLDHMWGSYETEETVNKLLLRNFEDFMKYYKLVVPEMYCAEIHKEYVFCFKDGTKLELSVKHLNKS